MYLFRTFFALSFLSGFVVFGNGYAIAETLFGVVSERNSATAAAAASVFKRTYADAEIKLRTPRQLAQVSDEQIIQHIQYADTVLVAGVFGDDAVRLVRLIEQSQKERNIYAVSSTGDLVSLSRDTSGRKNAGEQKSSDWQLANSYWQARGVENISNLFATLVRSDSTLQVPPPKPLAPVRITKKQGDANSPTVAIVDYDTGDQAGNVDLHHALCSALSQEKLGCFSVFADWGAASAEALELIREQKPSSIVLLQDFAIGGSSQSRAEKALESLNVPLVKGIRLNETEEREWLASSNGLPTDSVYYRVAMPELVGASQPMILAVGAPPKVDPVSGIEIRVTRPVENEVASAARRLSAWSKLQIAANAEKRLAVIYYNHPPGRHNIGADNLDVAASIFEILHRLKQEGYSVGGLPTSKEGLLDQIQQYAVNMPENNAVLAKLAETSPTLPLDAYNSWFAGLPALTKAEMVDGPLAALKVRVLAALENQKLKRASQIVADAIHDMEFVVEGAPVEYHERAEALLDQLKAAYQNIIAGSGDWTVIDALNKALSNQGIEGLRGWNEAPGDVMTHDGSFVFPSLQFGNVLIAPQPPRGWEVHEEVLHANMSVPPPHQYLAFYRWLQSEFKPHAMIHLGRHSTYEFLPGKRVGLAEMDYSRLIAGDIPGLYPYIVDGVGEGLQAKRRGLAVIIDHLTPPLKATPFYDELLGLRQLVESFEAADPSEAGEAARAQSLSRLKDKVIELGIKDALIAELEAEHGGHEKIEFETIAPDLLVHEVGHYLTDIQEDFMPLGLHVFGKDWDDEAIETMLESMGTPKAREKLAASPAAEMNALLNGLNGQFIKPGKGNDPLRSPESLPTGRNFYGIDASLVPNLIAWDIGSEMAEKAPDTGEGQAVVLWASDTVRDGGVMMAFGMKLLGVKPKWNARGIITGLERIEEPRHEVTFIASGLFRDLYGEQMKWLDKAVLLAIDGSSKTITEKFPHLINPLEEALAPLKELRSPGSESLSENVTAAKWVETMLADSSIEPGEGRMASLSLFAPAPGRYGAGINRLAERSGSWENREELGRSYIARMGHAYGDGINGEAQQDVFKSRLETTSESFLGRSSNLYGLVDNNDAFDYLGGLNMAVETVRGKPAKGYVIDVSDPYNPETTPLASAIVQELRGRQLNPHWIKSLMPHGYAGARTMSTAFFENLWGWEATDPNLFPDSIWEEANDIYINDKYALGMEEFLDGKNLKPVKANILAIMLVAAHKGYWQTSDEIIADIAEKFARVVVEAGLPGSGHTRPDHPMLDWVGSFLPTELAGELNAVRDAARGDVAPQTSPPELIRELKPQDTTVTDSQVNPWWILVLVGFVIVSGVMIGRRTEV